VVDIFFGVTDGQTDGRDIYIQSFDRSNIKQIHLSFFHHFRLAMQRNLKMKPSIKDGKKKIFLDDGDDSSVGSTSSPISEDTKLKVNKNYAKAFQNRKQREELQQVRDRDEDNDSDESSSEEEDEEGNLLTNSTNLQFLKTIKALRKKENSIYDKNTRFFDQEPDDDDDDDNEEREEKKQKPKRFKDVLRGQILEQMEEEENDSNNKGAEPAKSRFVYDNQQEEIRKSFLKGAEKVDSEQSDSDDDDLMVVKNRETTSPEDDNEMMEEFNEIEKISRTQSDKDKIVDPRGEIEDGDKYLLDFFKDKKWVDKEDDYANDDDSLDDLNKADDYEANYNFRFEQAQAEAASGATLSVQTYARGNTVNTVRRMDTTRKEKRQTRKERKAAERKAKEEQLKRLKNAKRQETNKKLAQIKSVLGSVDQEAVDEVAIMKMLEGDYDPEQFEKAMNTAYGDDFYENDDQEWKTDLDVREGLKADEDGEGIIGQDDVEGGMYDTHAGDEDEDEEDGHHGTEEEEDWGEEEDVAVEEDGAEETELEKKVKAKMQEELYKLDYEDIVAGMPTRFKYRKVEANDYGLSAREVLMARDTSLKELVSLKKMAAYNEEGEYHVGSKKRRRFRETLKQDLDEQEELAKAAAAKEATEAEHNEGEGEGEAENGEPKKKKRRRLKKGKKKDKEVPTTDDGEENKDTAELLVEPSKGSGAAESNEPKKTRRKKQGKKGLSSESNPKDDDNTNKDTKMASSEDPVSDSNQEVSTPVENKKKRKKKKKKEITGLPASRLSSYGL
jgi:protein KRI1